MSKSTHKQVALVGWGSPSKRRRLRANREKSLVWWYGPAVGAALLVSLLGISVAAWLDSTIPGLTPGWFVLASPVLVPVFLWVSYRRRPERVRRGWRVYIAQSSRMRKERPLAWWSWRVAYVAPVLFFVLQASGGRSIWLQVNGLLVAMEWLVFVFLELRSALRGPPARPLSRAATA